MYFSRIWGVEVRDEIVQEFTNPDGSIDDNLAGLHEVRARRTDQEASRDPAELDRELEAEQRALEAEGRRLLRKDRSAA